MLAAVGGGYTKIEAERDENVCRLDFAPSEAVSLGEALEPLERKAAKDRQVEAGKKRGRGKIACGKLPRAIAPKSRDAVGRAVGMSGKTYERAKAPMIAVYKHTERPTSEPPVCKGHRDALDLGYRFPTALAPGESRPGGVDQFREAVVDADDFAIRQRHGVSGGFELSANVGRRANADGEPLPTFAHVCCESGVDGFLSCRHGL